MTSQTVDLPGFFLQTDQVKRSLLKLTGLVAALLVESNPRKWTKHLRVEDGRKVIHVPCEKATCGTMNAMLLTCKKLAKLFVDWGFAMNPCDLCAFNKMIGKKQARIVFRIDDLLISHKSAHVVTMQIKMLDQEHGEMEDLAVTRGKVHECLEQTVDFQVGGECSFNQHDFIKKPHQGLPEDMKGKCRSAPAPDNPFKVGNAMEELDHNKKEQHHTITAKTHWISQQSRPDLQLARGFHSTRAKNPTVEDWEKLKQ